MSTLGSGLEAFGGYLDVEAEATVSIKSEDDAGSDIGGMDTGDDSGVTEETIATDEKKDEEIDTTVDNINNSEKVMSSLVDELYNTYSIINVGTKYGMSAGLVDYLNRHSNIVDRWRSMGVYVPALEADAPAKDAGGEKSFLGKAKDAAIKIWETIKKWFIKIKEFFIQLGKTIYSKFVGQKKRIIQLKEIVSKAHDTVIYPKEIADVKVPRIQNIEDVYKTVKTIFDKVTVDSATRGIDMDVKSKTKLLDAEITIGQQAGLKSKATVLNLLKHAEDIVNTDLEAKLRPLTDAVDQKLKDIDTEKAKGDKGNPDAFKKSLEIFKTKREAFVNAMSLANKLVNAIIFIGNLFVRGDKLAGDPDAKKANESYYRLMVSSNRLTNAVEAFNGLSIGAEGRIRNMYESFVAFLKKIKNYFFDLADKFVKWIRKKFDKQQDLKKELEASPDTIRFEGSEDIKVMKYDNLVSFKKTNELLKELTGALSGSKDAPQKAVEEVDRMMRQAAIMLGQTVHEKVNMSSDPKFKSKSNIYTLLVTVDEIEKSIPTLEQLKKDFASRLVDIEAKLNKISNKSVTDKYDPEDHESANRYDPKIGAKSNPYMDMQDERKCASTIVRALSTIIGRCSTVISQIQMVASKYIEIGKANKKVDAANA